MLVFSTLIILFTTQITSQQTGYIKGPNALTWYESLYYCSSVGSSLATIKNVNENNEVSNLCGNNNCWIGLNDLELHGYYAFLDGTLASENGYQNWATNEPSNIEGRREDCVNIQYDGTWNNNICNEIKYHPICNPLPTTANPTTSPTPSPIAPPTVCKGINGNINDLTVLQGNVYSYDQGDLDCPNFPFTGCGYVKESAKIVSTYDMTNEYDLAFTIDYESRLFDDESSTEIYYNCGNGDILGLTISPPNNNIHLRTPYLKKGFLLDNSCNNNPNVIITIMHHVGQTLHSVYFNFENLCVGPANENIISDNTEPSLIYRDFKGKVLRESEPDNNFEICFDVTETCNDPEIHLIYKPTGSNADYTILTNNPLKSHYCEPMTQIDECSFNDWIFTQCPAIKLDNAVTQETGPACINVLINNADSCVYTDGSNVTFAGSALLYCSKNDELLDDTAPTSNDLIGYIKGPNALTWYESLNYCSRLGSSLATIKNANENNEASNLCGNNNCWIGLNDLELHGYYQFLDGSLAIENGYQNWATNEPSNDEQRRERCVNIQSDGTWNNNICNEIKYKPICNPSTTVCNAVNGNLDFTILEGSVSNNNDELSPPYCPGFPLTNCTSMQFNTTIASYYDMTNVYDLSFTIDYELNHKYNELDTTEIYYNCGNGDILGMTINEENNNVHINTPYLKKGFLLDNSCNNNPLLTIKIVHKPNSIFGKPFNFENICVGPSNNNRISHDSEPSMVYRDIQQVFSTVSNTNIEVCFNINERCVYPTLYLIYLPFISNPNVYSITSSHGVNSICEPMIDMFECGSNGHNQCNKVLLNADLTSNEACININIGDADTCQGFNGYTLAGYVQLYCANYL